MCQAGSLWKRSRRICLFGHRLCYSCPGGQNLWEGRGINASINRVLFVQYLKQVLKYPFNRISPVTGRPPLLTGLTLWSTPELVLPADGLDKEVPGLVKWEWSKKVTEGTISLIYLGVAATAFSSRSKSPTPSSSISVTLAQLQRARSGVGTGSEIFQGWLHATTTNALRANFFQTW